MLDHYRALFTERNFWVPIRNSLIVAGATTLFCVAIGGLCAYALARLEFRGKGLLLGFVLAVGMFPQISVVSPLYLLLRELRLINTYPGLVLPYLTFAMPLTVWLLVGFFRQLPAELEEAAMVDGASRLRAFREVIVPLALPGLATTAILTFVYSWNEFLFALSFTLGPERQTVPVAIALFRGQYQVPWGQILAAAARRHGAGDAARARLPAADRAGPHRRRGERASHGRRPSRRHRQDVPQRPRGRPGPRPRRSRTASSWCWSALRLRQEHGPCG